MPTSIGISLCLPILQATSMATIVGANPRTTHAIDSKTSIADSATVAPVINSAQERRPEISGPFALSEFLYTFQKRIFQKIPRGPVNFGFRRKAGATNIALCGPDFQSKWNGSELESNHHYRSHSAQSLWRIFLINVKSQTCHDLGDWQATPKFPRPSGNLDF